MSEAYHHESRKSIAPYLVIPFILLTLLYFLAKGCTDSSDHRVTTESSNHAAKADNQGGGEKNEK